MRRWLTAEPANPIRTRRPAYANPKLLHTPRGPCLRRRPRPDDSGGSPAALGNAVSASGPEQSVLGELGEPRRAYDHRVSEVPKADRPPTPSPAPAEAQALGARPPDEGSAQGGGQKDPQCSPQEDAQRGGKGAPLLVIAIVGGGYLIHWLARTGLFPAHPKTLARDAAILGFIGGLFLVEELVRKVVDEPPRNLVLAINLAASILLVLVTRGFALWVRLVAIFTLVLGVSQAKSASPATGRRAKMAPAVRYGAVGLGVALLVLALFLQLRSIDLSKS
jgi:hypothetical protein